jgi:4-amino-4-deoxy-L-arabinose transferase-like glycosyltransferase
MTKAMTSPDGGILALVYYLFIEFGVIASRSFQPDPLMVGLILCSLWAFYRCIRADMGYCDPGGSWVD